MRHLHMRNRILARNLQRRAINEIKHDGVRQLLSVQVRRVRLSELGEREPSSGRALVRYSLWNVEFDSTCVVDGYHAAFPELVGRYVSLE